MNGLKQCIATTRHRYCRVVVVILTCIGSVFAQPSNPWLPLSTQGMLGAHVKAFTQGKGGDMILMSRTTVYRSTNMGGSWFKASTGLPAHRDSLYCIASNPGGDLFVGTNDGVYRSLDNGLTWQKKSKGIERLKIEVLFVDSSGVVFAGVYGQVFRSLDTANTWTETATDIPIKYKDGVPRLRYSYADGIRVSFGSWIYGTKNLGATWKQVTPSNGGSDYIEAEYMYDVETAVEGAVMYDAYYNAGFRNYRTDEVCSPQTDMHQARIINAYVSEILKWKPTILEGHEYSGFAAVRSDSVLMGTCDHGVVKIALCGTCNNDSNNGAGRFVNYGLKNMSVSALYKARNGTVFCGTRGGGVYYSTNHGESWTESIQGLTEPSVYDLLLPKAGDKRFIAATASGVYVSLDSGQTWSRRVQGMNDYLVFTLEYTKNGTLLAGTENGINRSLDSGMTWTFVKAPVLTYKDIYSSPTPYRNVSDFLVLGNNTILAATSSSTYWSKDDGKTWSLRGPAYPNPGYEARQTAMAWDTLSNTIYIAAALYYLATTDTAKTCTATVIPGGVYTTAVIQPESKTLFMSGSTNIISVDLKAKPLVTNSMIGDINANLYEFGAQGFKSDPLGHLMLGTMSRGSYFSNDGGATWLPWNNGMYEKDVLGFVQDANYHLYALTANNGIYRSERPTASLAAPELVSPVIDSSTSSLTLSFEWKSVPDAQRYNLQASTDSTFSKAEIDDKTIQTLTKQITFSNPGLYYWRVRATRGSLLSPWSTIRRLEIQSALPAKVELVSPMRDSVVNTATVVLQWKSAARTDNYSIQVAHDTTFATQHTNATGIASLGVQSNTLTSNTNYYWRVQAKNSQGVGEWSDIWPFRTGVITSNVQDESFDDVTIAPNPATDKLEILYHGKATPCHIVIRDLQGRELLRSTTLQTDVSMLAQGVYACEIKGSIGSKWRFFSVAR